MMGSIGKWGLTRRGKGILIASALLYGMVFIVPDSAVWSTTAIASFLVIFLLTSKIVFEFKIRAASDLKPLRIFSRPAIENKLLDVSVRLVNDSVTPLESIEIHDSYPPMFKLIDGSSIGVILVPSKGYVELSYKVNPVLGRHCFKGPIIRVRDPAGLFSEDIELNAENCIMVQPLYEPIVKKTILPGAIYMPGGRSVSRRRGIGTQFIETREYVPGDDYRLIEWKATARTGRLMVKEFEQETSLEVILVLDTRSSMGYGTIGKTKFEYMVRGAAAIADHLIRRGDLIGLAYSSKERAVIVRPARGRTHIFSIIRTLSAVDWPHNDWSPDFPRLVKQVFTSIGSRGRRLYIIFSDLEMGEEEFDELIDILVKIRSLRNDIIIISPFTPYFELEGLRGIQGLVYRLYASRSVKEREALVMKLMKLGITVVNVGPEDFVSKTLLRIEALRTGVTGLGS
ncbi:MAG: DUF58 domain-containing protein [Desulfurococcales archaeon]|nr:DUF58 domain-containing protein [Desulfurococcales archaeon]